MRVVGLAQGSRHAGCPAAGRGLPTLPLLRTCYFVPFVDKPTRAYFFGAPNGYKPGQHLNISWNAWLKWLMLE